MYFDGVRDCYEAFVIYTFLTLLLAYTGGDAACVAGMQADGHTVPHAKPLSFCLPVMIPNSRFLRRCKQFIIQFVIVKPLMAVATVVLSRQPARTALFYSRIQLVVYNVSYSLALYYLYLFYVGARTLLAPYKPVKQFFSIKMVVFATYWQMLLLTTLPFWTRAESALINTWVLAVEMLLFSLVHAFAFSFWPYCAVATARPAPLATLRHILSPHDVVVDAVNTFSRRSSRYALLSTVDIDATEYQAPTRAPEPVNLDDLDDGQVDTGDESASVTLP